MKVVSLWSGGKDSCFACYKAQQQGYQVCGLINFIASDGKNSLSHGLAAELVLKQARLTDIPVFQKAMPKEKYRDEFKAIIGDWKREKGIEGVVFGDIYLTEHKDWIDKVCAEIPVKPILPLWGRDTRELIFEIINSGFKAIVVSARADLFGKESLGKRINKEFIRGISPGIDPCGEKGEFHTFVYNGPIFNKPVEFVTKKKVLKNKHWFLEVNLKKRIKEVMWDGEKNTQGKENRDRLSEKV